VAWQATQRDLDLLATVAEYRVLTPQMLATILGRNVRALRRRVSALMHADLLVADRRYPRFALGRPERMLSLSVRGAELLMELNILSPRTEPKRAMRPADALLKHLMAMNELRTQLSQIPRIQPELSVRFLSSTSPFLPTWAKGRPIVYDRFRDSDGRQCSLIPDGALALSHATLGKTLLFFVEIDMGTETLVSSSGHRGDLWHKVVTYQAYYACNAYKRYEKIWNSQLHRFRVLLLANSRGRAGAISRLLRDVGTTDFILVADQAHMMTDCVWAAIWRPGGKLDQPEVSILGSHMPVPYPNPIEAQVNARSQG